MPLGVQQRPDWIAKRIASRLATLRVKGFPKSTGPKTQEGRDAASERMRAMWRDPTWRAKAIAAAKMPKGPATPERRAQVSAQFKGKKQDPEFVARRTASLKGRKLSPEVRARISSSRMGIRPTDEQRKKMSESQRGRKHSLETRMKISAANQGKTISEKVKAILRSKAIGRIPTAETRAKLAEASRRRRGHLSPRWQGGISSENARLRNAEDVRIWRLKVYERDHFTCRKCGTKGGYLNAHHIKPFAKFPELRTDIDNGITLCRSCHKKTHDAMREAARK